MQGRPSSSVAHNDVNKEAMKKPIKKKQLTPQIRNVPSISKAKPWKPEPCGISNEEMRVIVAKMIG